jgi:hypothetical protein
VHGSLTGTSIVESKRNFANPKTIKMMIKPIIANPKALNVETSWG